jgi:hypothetical protein
MGPGSTGMGPGSTGRVRVSAGRVWVSAGLGPSERGFTRRGPGGGLVSG